MRHVLLFLATYWPVGSLNHYEGSLVRLESDLRPLSMLVPKYDWTFAINLAPVFISRKAVKRPAVRTRCAAAIPA
jgi:hypothetical protein